MSQTDFPLDFDTWSDNAKQAYLALLERTINAEQQLEQSRNDSHPLLAAVANEDETLSWRSLVLKMLAELSFSASSSLDISDVLTSIARLTAMVVDGTSAYVCDWDESHQTTTVIAHYISEKASDAEKKSDLGFVYDTHEGFVQRLHDPKRYWMSHVDDEDLSPHEQEELRYYGAKTILCVPMYAKDDIVGYLEVWETRYKRHFIEHEIEFVQAVARQAAGAVRNSQLNQELGESQARYRMLVDTMSEGLLQVNQDGIIIFVNQRLCDLLGYSQEELLHSSYDDVLLNCFKLSREHMLLLMTVGVHEVPIQPQGIPLWMQVSYTPMYDRHRRPVGAIYVYTDISKRKQAAEHEKQIELEQERIKVLAEFIQNASHEFYTPLSIIRTSLYLLKKPERAHLQAHYFSDIASQAEAISKLVSALVLMTSLDSTSNLSTTPTYLRQLLRSALHRVEEEADSKGQAIHLTIADDSLSAPINAEKMLIALTQLLENAVHYTPEGGVIYMKAAQIGAEICIEVADNGFGMSPEIQARVFERFYRADEAHTTRGFGLGLPIAKRIVEMHRGYIELATAEGAGARFIIHLPV